MKIRKAVIAAAGFGTRFLPTTKAVQKELLPIVDRPIIHHLVEEAVASGIEEIIFVLREGSTQVVEYFAESPRLEKHLAKAGKLVESQFIHSISGLAQYSFSFQTQDLPYGNATPLLSARAFLDPAEAFVYVFGDDLVVAESPCMRQLIDVFQCHRPFAVIAAKGVFDESISQFGVLSAVPGTTPLRLQGIVEKPNCHQAPSNLAQIGRFAISGEIWNYIDNYAIPDCGEFSLSDLWNRAAAAESLIIHEIQGAWLTTGDPLHYLIATVEYAIRHPVVGRAFQKFLKQHPFLSRE